MLMFSLSTHTHTHTHRNARIHPRTRTHLFQQPLQHGPMFPALLNMPLLHCGHPLLYIFPSAWQCMTVMMVIHGHSGRGGERAEEVTSVDGGT